MTQDEEQLQRTTQELRRAQDRLAELTKQVERLQRSNKELADLAQQLRENTRPDPDVVDAETLRYQKRCRELELRLEAVRRICR